MQVLKGMAGCTCTRAHAHTCTRMLLLCENVWGIISEHRYLVLGNEFIRTRVCFQDLRCACVSEKVSWSGHARSGVEGLAVSRRQSGDHDEGLEALRCLSSPARRRSLACWKGALPPANVETLAGAVCRLVGRKWGGGRAGWGKVGSTWKIPFPPRGVCFLEHSVPPRSSLGHM